MPTAWRLIKTKFAGDPLSATGARLYGGRWNSAGISVVYFAESISLAVLEVLVHLEAARLLESYSLIRIDFSDTAVQTVAEGELPATWADFPAPDELQDHGNEWVQSGESPLLEVPSAIVPLEHIFLLNPNHRDTPTISVSKPIPFRFDPRLFS